MADEGPCADSSRLAFNLATELYNTYKDSLQAAFDSLYLGKCLTAYRYEDFTVTAQQSEFHYTLYYYDQAGNLVKTVPPAGVDGSKFGWLTNWSDSVKTARINAQSLIPSHQLPTNYRYNTMNQVVEQHSPDGGGSQFWYDRLGRLKLSQNAKQVLGDWFSYTRYDQLGRINEVGELNHVSGPSLITVVVTRNEAEMEDLVMLNSKRQITSTYYDHPYIGFSGLTEPLVARNLRNRVSYSTFTAGSNPSLFDQATFYSYDIHGNVDTLLQDFRTGVMNEQGQRFKKMVYQYDLISGKVNHVAYQPGKADQFYHKYAYDGENRLTQTFTSADSIIWEQDASYSYLLHGPIARTQLGQQKVQGMDYAYTLQGWLKAINGNGSTMEIGLDGSGAWVPNGFVARDAYAVTLHYNRRDYESVGGSCNCISEAYGPLGSQYRDLYNGNITGMSVNIPKINYPVDNSSGIYLGTMYYNYRYDQLNRITGMNAHTLFVAPSQTWPNYMYALEDYKERVRYDANGNILSYLRNGTTIGGGPLAMDSLSYKYYAGNNRLRQVRDSVSATNYTEDIDDQSDENNYVYDAIGNLVQDKNEGIDSIQWNVYGKISNIYKSSGLWIGYTYDASGNRISKKVRNGADSTSTWYVRDASGNVMSVYSIKNETARQEEIHLYGSSRLGIVKPERILNLDRQIGDTSGTLSLLGGWKGKVFRRGMKFFELSNHLGNVLVTLSDKKLGIDNNGDSTIEYYMSNVMTANDYYPGGMLMPGKEYSNYGADYRYSINGQEKAKEINTNITSAEYWMYDSRIVKRWNLDPKPNISVSPYNCFAGNPIWYSDKKGDIIKGENGFDKAAYRASLVEQITILKGYKKNGLPGALEVNEKNLNEKLREFNAALKTFDELEARKEVIVVGRGEPAMNADEAWTKFDKIQNAPRVDLGSNVKDGDYFLISHELQHVEDYYKGNFSFSADGFGGILIDIYDEVGPNNRQEIISAGIVATAPNPTVWTHKTLPNKVFKDGTTPYTVLPADKRVLSDLKWSSFLKTETAKSVQNNTPQPHYYVGWERDRAEAEAAKKAEDEKKKNAPPKQ